MYPLLSPQPQAIPGYGYFGRGAAPAAGHPLPLLAPVVYGIRDLVPEQSYQELETRLSKSGRGTFAQNRFGCNLVPAHKIAFRKSAGDFCSLWLPVFIVVIVLCKLEVLKVHVIPEPIVRALSGRNSLAPIHCRHRMRLKRNIYAKKMRCVCFSLFLWIYSGTNSAIKFHQYFSRPRRSQGQQIQSSRYTQTNE